MMGSDERAPAPVTRGEGQQNQAPVVYAGAGEGVNGMRSTLHDALKAVTDFKSLDQIQELDAQLERLATDLDIRIAAAQQDLVDLRSLQFDVGIRRESTRFLLRSLMEGGFADWEAKNLSQLRGGGGTVVGR